MLPAPSAPMVTSARPVVLGVVSLGVPSLLSPAPSWASGTKKGMMEPEWVEAMLFSSSSGMM